MRFVLVLVAALVIRSTPAGADCQAVAELHEPRPGRTDIALGAGAGISRDLALANGALVWTSGRDVWWLGDGGRGCLARIATLPSGPSGIRGSARVAVAGDQLVEVTQTAKALPETPQTFLVHDGFLYTTVFRGDTIYKIALATGRIGTFAKLPAQSGRNGISLAQHGELLFVASYGQRWLGELPFSTGVLRVIARGFSTGPTALAVDDGHAYVYCESTRRSTGSLQSVALATGKASVLATNLINSDGVLLDDAWLYLRTLARGAVQLVRVRADGSSGVELVESGLPAGARPVAADAEAIYLDARGQIVRLDKQQLTARDR